MEHSFLLLFSVVALVVAKLEDPLCVAKGCPQSTVCRVVQECVQGVVPCTMRAECLEAPPKFSHVGVCQIGDPVLVLVDGIWDDTRCGPSLPCPIGAYCNTDLADTYATCCRSDPASPVKQGKCPNVADTDRFFCVDTCSNDGDCRHGDKCCHSGCSKRCHMAQLDDPCDNKTCVLGKFCLRPSMPRCQGPGRCWEIGDCIPCPLIRNCPLKCPQGFSTDNKGCPKCQCKIITRRPAPENYMTPTPPQMTSENDPMRNMLLWHILNK
ncbi:hypothetical protein Btru_006831, partial [Bulinus truncatus]